MITYEPQSTIILCRVPWNENQKNNILFSSSAKKKDYFDKLPNTLSFSNYTFVRKNSSIKVNINYEEAKKYNYLYYINNNVSNSYVYCFITSCNYINDNLVELNIKTDVIVTYQELFMADTSTTSFVERMIVAKSKDNIKDNLVAEGLETGEYLIRKIDKTDICHPLKTTTGYYVPMMVIMGLSEKYDNLTYSEIQGSFSNETEENCKTGSLSGLYYVAFDIGNDTVRKFVNAIDKSGKSEIIYTLFAFPKTLLNNVETRTITLSSTNVAINYFSFSTTVNETSYSTSITNNKAFDGYVPRNNKLYSSPYSYMLLDNSTGGMLKCNYEYFKDCYNPSFKLITAFAQGVSARLYPLDYKNVIGLNKYESVDLMKFPTFSWNTDSYTNWLTQTAVSRAESMSYIQSSRDIQKNNEQLNSDRTNYGFGTSLIGNTVDFVKNLATGNIAGASSSAVSAITSSVSFAFDKQALELQKQSNALSNEHQINSILNSVQEHSFLPNAIHNGSATADVIYQNSDFDIKIFHLCISKDYAQRIDNYFDRFGYKVNNFFNLAYCLKTRNKWNYVKTISCNFVTSNIPADDELEIKNIFNNGITLWKDPTYIYNYSLSND